MFGPPFQQSFLAETADIPMLSHLCSRKQSLLGLQAYDFASLREVATFVSLENVLWESQVQWAEVTAEWKKTILRALDLSKVDNTLVAFNKTIARLERDFMPNKVMLLSGRANLKACLPALPLSALTAEKHCRCCRTSRRWSRNGKS